MVAGEVESSCQLVVTFFFIEISLGQPSPPSYQLLPPPLMRSTGGSSSNNIAVALDSA